MVSYNHVEKVLMGLIILTYNLHLQTAQFIREFYNNTFHISVIELPLQLPL